MARMRKKPKAPPVKRNPLARALGLGQYRAKATPRPDAYRRKPKHRKARSEADET
jgi:hypothetical protein